MKDFFIKIRNAKISFLYRKLLKPVLFKINPEFVHDLFTLFGQILGSNPITRKLCSLSFNYRNKMLEQKVAGIYFKNPIGLAAGFDKNAKFIKILPEIGFGYEEAGSITAEPCKGNPKPRLWRIPEKKALRVYYGLANQGAKRISKRLIENRAHAYLKSKRFPLGISIAKTNCKATADTKTAIADYAKGMRAFRDIANFFTINISCPNAYGGLPFTDHKKLDALLKEIKKIKTKKPIFLKMSPDLTDKEVDDIIALAKKHRLTGFVCTNLSKKDKPAHGQQGGISGLAVQKASDVMISKIYRKTKGRFVIIGVGGIFTAEDAYRKIRLGASLLQMITGMIYEGPQQIGSINRGLAALLKRDGCKSIQEAVGIDSQWTTAKPPSA